MPRKRKTIEGHVIGGSRPGRIPVTPSGDGVGEPPTHITAALCQLWIELANLVPAGIGSPADAPAFELMCRLTARVREGAFSAADTQQLRTLYASFGMMPDSAARASLPAPEAPTRLQRFLDDAPQLRRKRGLAKFVD